MYTAAFRSSRSAQARDLFRGPEVEGDGTRIDLWRTSPASEAAVSSVKCLWEITWCFWTIVHKLCRCRRSKSCITFWTIAGHGSAHGMHSVQVEAHRHYPSISPTAELKVHVFLNIGHQRGCKVLTSGVFTIFIYSLRHGRTDGDILRYYES